jgi:hypothetical protein
MHSDPSPVAHKFITPELSYEQAPNKQKYLRILTFFKKKPGISFEYFLNHWHHVHTDLVVNMKSFKENNIFHYTQFYQTPKTREQGKSLGYMDMEWDACSEFWVERIEDYHAFIQSQEYRDSLRMPAQHAAIEFSELTTVQMMLTISLISTAG